MEKLILILAIFTIAFTSCSKIEMPTPTPTDEIVTIPVSEYANHINNSGEWNVENLKSGTKTTWKFYTNAAMEKVEINNEDKGEYSINGSEISHNNETLRVSNMVKNNTKNIITFELQDSAITYKFTKNFN